MTDHHGPRRSPGPLPHTPPPGSTLRQPPRLIWRTAQGRSPRSHSSFTPVAPMGPLVTRRVSASASVRDSFRPATTCRLASVSATKASSALSGCKPGGRRPAYARLRFCTPPLSPALGEKQVAQRVRRPTAVALCPTRCWPPTNAPQSDLAGLTHGPRPTAGAPSLGRDESAGTAGHAAARSVI
jgi:hypothetical protein